MKSSSALISFIIGMHVFFGLFLLYPLWFVFSDAFTNDGKFTLEFFTLALNAPELKELVGNTFDIASSVTLLSLGIGGSMAFFMTRFAIPFKSVLHLLILLPFVLPPFVGVVGVKQLFGRFGTVNLLLMQIGLLSVPLDWLSPGSQFGVVVLEVTHFVPVIYLTVAASLRGMTPVLEDAAKVSGAGPFKILLKIILPLAWPGILAGTVLVFVSSFTELGAPLLLEYRKVVPVYIFNMLSDLHVNKVGLALACLVAVMCAVLFFLTSHLMPKEELASTNARRVSNSLKNSWTLSGAAIFILIGSYSLFSLLPHLGILLTAFSKTWFLTAFPTAYTLQHFLTVLEYPLTRNGILMSIQLSFAAVLLIVLFSLLIAYSVKRTRIRGKRSIEILALLPLAIPGLLFALGYVLAFSGTILDPRRNPIPLLIIAYTVRRLPTMLRSAIAGISDVHPQVIDAARVSGASTALIFRRIVAPLISRHIFAGSIMAFTFCMLEVSDSLFLALEERYFPISKTLYTLLGRPDGIELAAALGVLIMILLSCSYSLAYVLESKKP